MFKSFLLVLALFCCAHGIRHIPNRSHTDPPLPKDLISDVGDVLDPQEDAFNLLSQAGFINQLESKIEYGRQLGADFIQNIANNLKSIEVKGKLLSVAEKIFTVIKTALSRLRADQEKQLENLLTEELKTRYTRQNTGKQSENAISDNLTNATQIITEGMVKLYDDLHKELIANKNKLIRSSLSLIGDFLPVLELQIKEILGVIETYLEETVHQTGNMLEGVINNSSEEREKRKLIYKVKSATSSAIEQSRSYISELYDQLKKQTEEFVNSLY